MDPIALLTSTVVATMVSALLFLLPGAALGSVVLPGAMTPLGRLGRAAGVSLVVTLPTCTLMARFGVLSAASVLAALLALTAVGLILHRPRIHRHLGRSRGRRWWAAAVAASGLVLALIIVPSHVAVRPDLLPVSSTTWYYLHLAQATADLGGFPVALPEWGAMRPFQTDYLPVTAHTAAALLLLPGDTLARLELYRLVVLGLAALFTTLLFRRWVSSWVAVLGAILLVGTVRLEGKFDGYRPETVGLVLAIFTLWVVDRALVERSRRSMVVAVALAALVFLSHAEVFLILAPAIIGMGLARGAVGGGGPLGVRRPSRRGVMAGVLAACIVVAGIGVATVGAWGLTGELGVLGYVVGDEAPAPDAASARGRPGEVPAGWTFTNDPTWDFYTASVAPALNGLPPPGAFTDSLLLPRSIVLIWPGLDGRNLSGRAVLALLVMLPLLAWPWLDARRRRWLLGWAIFAVLLTVGSMLLFAISDTYVPQRTAGRRLMPYLLFVPVIAGTTLLWLTGKAVVPYWRALWPGQAVRHAIATGLALAVLTVGAVSASPLARAGADAPDAALSPTGFAAYQWMATNLPTDARILANAYTDGALGAVTGRVGIVDGRAVYLEDPDFLAESTALSLGARVVFATPAAPGTGTYLARERVTHLLVATDGPLGRDLGGYLLFETDVDAIRDDPRFDFVRAFDGDRLLLFAVTGASARLGAG